MWPRRRRRRSVRPAGCPGAGSRWARWGIPEGRPPARRQPAEATVEDEQRHHPQQEGGGGRTGEQHAAQYRGATPAHRGEVGEHGAQEHGHEQDAAGEFEAGGQYVGEVGGDGSAGPQRVLQVAVEQPRQVVQIAGHQGFVEPQAGAGSVDGRLGGVGADVRLGGVDAGHLLEGEQEHGQGEQYPGRRRYATQDEFHVSVLPFHGAGPPRFHGVRPLRRGRSGGFTGAAACRGRRHRRSSR